jgi:predicted metal-dependent HD superfamily phosphohydrolase
MTDDLLRRYAEPHRRYHTLEHIRDVLSRVDPDPLVEIVVWFHDAVYDTHRTDNEEQSAALAAAFMRDRGFTEVDIDLVTRAIRATAKHEPDDLPPQMLRFLDADLAILGSDPARYDAYARQIREEYAWVPEEVYRRERARILRAFLDRPRIYFVDGNREAAARENLTREIGMLSFPDP